MADNNITTQTNQETSADAAAEVVQNEATESVRVELPSADQRQQQAPEVPNVLARGLFQRHMRLDPVLLVYIIVLFAGGVYGYIEKSSSISLVSGVIFSLFLLAGAYFEGVRKNFYPLIITLVVVAAGFIYRYLQNVDKFFPSGFYAMLTLIMLLRHGYIIYLKHQAP